MNLAAYFSVSLLLLLSTVSAQITANLVSGANGISCTACSTNKSWPAGKDLGTRFSLASTCTGGGEARFHAELTTGPTLYLTETCIPHFYTTSGSATSSSVVLTLTSSTRVTGFLWVIVSADTTYSPAVPQIVRQSIDIGADGNVEVAVSSAAQHRLTRNFPVVIDSSGLKVAINESTSVGYSLRMPRITARITLMYMASAGCTISSFGTGCGSAGPVLRAVGPSVNVITFLHSRAPAVGAGFMVVGVNPLAIPLPLQGCLQHTETMILVPVQLAPQETRHSVLLPANFRGAARVQFVSFQPPYNVLDLRTSNGLHFVCQ